MRQRAGGGRRGRRAWICTKSTSPTSPEPSCLTRRKWLSLRSPSLCCRPRSFLQSNAPAVCGLMAATCRIDHRPALLPPRSLFAASKPLGALHFSRQTSPRSATHTPEQRPGRKACLPEHAGSGRSVQKHQAHPDFDGPPWVSPQAHVLQRSVDHASRLRTDGCLLVDSRDLALPHCIRCRDIHLPHPTHGPSAATLQNVCSMCMVTDA